MATMRIWTMAPAAGVLLLALAAIPAAAQPAPDPALAAKAAQRFPQPVRVGDLVGRAMLKPIEAQPILGRVVAVVRRADGGVDLIVRTGGVLGFGGRPVAVPSEAVGLLGEHVALLGIAPDRLSALPTAEERAGQLNPEEVVRIGLVKPFH